MDESSVQLNPNRRRILNTRVVSYDEGRAKRRSKTVFGFMALNGKDVAMVSEKARKEDLKRFMELVKRENADAPILAIMDNIPTHKATIVRERCEELRIHQVFLPPYSPDLNPIEFGWKDLKRELAAILDFDAMVEQSKERI